MGSVKRAPLSAFPGTYDHGRVLALHAWAGSNPVWYYRENSVREARAVREGLAERGLFLVPVLAEGRPAYKLGEP